MRDAARAGRGVANRVVFGTGVGQDESVPDVPPHHEAQTAVFLMAVSGGLDPGGGGWGGGGW